MELILLRHAVRRLALGAHTSWHAGAMCVSLADVHRLFPARGGIRLRDVRAASPGDSLRFGPVLDVVGARCGVDGSAFPGWNGAAPAGERRTLHILDNLAISVAANLPGIQEGLIDMTAPMHSPFANLHHLLCVVEVEKGADKEAADAAIRRFQCRLAEHVAAHAVHSEADRQERFTWPLPGKRLLPRVGMAYLVQSQGVLRRTYLDGVALDAGRLAGSDADRLGGNTAGNDPGPFAPAAISPLRLLSGALVSGNYVLCCNKTCTYIHQEHPVVRQMLLRHGTDFDFGGVVMANEASTTEGKCETAREVARLARESGWQGAVVNQEGGGNADTDCMLVCRELERAGIATVLLVNEFAGPDGLTPSLAETTPEARWIVSTGNNDAVLELGAVQEAPGFLEGLLGPLPAGPVKVPMTRLYASTNQLGYNVLSCETR